MIERLVSGGQTGVDRAALDLALSLSLPCGGWCPRGRQAEDGLLDSRYPLQETPSSDYAQRTEWNVRDADGTLIIALGALTGGTALTGQFTEQLGKPCLVIDLDSPPPVATTADWLIRHRIKTLNVAGPRESTHPGIYRRAREFLAQVLLVQQS